ncbi:hypothetical protein [uncultured Desulfobacter sp.]|uniref:hypothetical protein n=1 Tax=uncultured Desulfobacter sp. TaxID=240139 RepID=UPI002AAB188E|nr:hypothetical protein [uncultured Desulfobacter sp.]
MKVFKPEDLLNFGTTPTNKTAFSEWVNQSDVVDFLCDDLQDPDIILHASFDTLLLNSVLAPAEVLSELTPKALSSWSHDNSSGWSICEGMGRDKPWLEPPMSSSQPEQLKVGEQLLFQRSFYGVKGREHYYELSDKFLQIMGLHYMHELSAWCKLDDNGDIDQLVKVHSIGKRGIVISIRWKLLAEYCYLTETVVVRLFDVERVDRSNFTAWDDDHEEMVNDRGVSGKRKIMPGHASYFRGGQAFKPEFKKEAVEIKQFESFIALDWKNGRTEEISCAPEAIDNYFTKSDKPYEMSPAFFKAEVLLKYKGDIDKYSLSERRLTSRAGWELKTFDINEAGQVHTYLIYLQGLPHREQLHWKQYNEQPKTALSDRAVATDFQGNFYDGYYPVAALKKTLEKIDNQGVTWWIMKNRVLKDALHPVVTQSAAEWKEEILKLDQVLIEGFVKKELKVKAIELGQKPPASDRELKLLEKSLIGSGFDEEQAYDVLTPFHQVHYWRSVLKGHIFGKTAQNIETDALNEFGTLRAHFDDLCERCDESMKIILEAIGPAEK